MKIEVGDIVNTLYSRNVEVLDVTPGACNKSEYRVWFTNDFGDKTNTLLENCTLVKEGEKKMMYKGIEAYKALQEGKILHLGENSGWIFKMNKGEVIQCPKDQAYWSNCTWGVNAFLTKTFTEYKEPLKYKVGDEVWVKATVTDVHDDDIRGYKLKTSSAYEVHVKEQDVKGIDE